MIFYNYIEILLTEFCNICKIYFNIIISVFRIILKQKVNIIRGNANSITLPELTVFPSLGGVLITIKKEANNVKKAANM